MLDYSKENSEFTIDYSAPVDKITNFRIYNYSPTVIQNDVYIINISNPSETDNLQVNFEIEFISGMNPEFTNIRFCTTKGVCIPHWIENKVYEDTASVWVKLPTGIKTILMYFDTYDAEDSSNGTEVFEWFDDGINLDNWGSVISYNGGTGSLSSVDGALQIDSTNSTGISYPAISEFPTGEFAIRFRKIYSDAPTNGQFRIQITDTTSPDPSTKRGIYHGVDNKVHFSLDNVNDHNVSHNFAVSEPEVWDFNTGVNGRLIINGETKISVVNSLQDYTNLHLRIWSYSYTTVQLDWIAVRKFALEPPVLTAAYKATITETGISIKPLIAQESFIIESDSETIEVVPVTTMNRFTGVS